MSYLVVHLVSIAIILILLRIDYPKLNEQEKKDAEEYLPWILIIVFILGPLLLLYSLLKRFLIRK